jgi:hypothetical protein
MALASVYPFAATSIGTAPACSIGSSTGSLADRFNECIIAHTEEVNAKKMRYALLIRPSDTELNNILTFYNRQPLGYQRDPRAAVDVVGKQAGSPVPVRELASWTTVANVLLNMDESISKE